MPTVKRIGPDRFFFYASDRDEPAHVHTMREDKIAKFWLDPLRLQNSGGFSRVEIGRIQKIIRQHQRDLLEAKERKNWQLIGKGDVHVPGGPALDQELL